MVEQEKARNVIFFFFVQKCKRILEEWFEFPKFQLDDLLDLYLPVLHIKSLETKCKSNRMETS